MMINIDFIELRKIFSCESYIFLPEERKHLRNSLILAYINCVFSTSDYLWYFLQYSMYFFLLKLTTIRMVNINVQQKYENICF